MTIRNSISKIILVAALLSCAGCGENKGVTLSFGSLVAQNFILDFFVPSAYASVEETKMCFKRLRFKIDQQETIDKENSSDNIDFAIGEVTLANGGTTLATVTVPAAAYKRVEFDLEDDCGTGSSLKVTNDHGTYETHSSINLKFEGDFTSDGGEQSLVLQLDAIQSALENYSGSGQLKNAVEDAEGKF